MRILANELETEAAGIALADALDAVRGAVVTLRGELGAGKTTLVRGFLHRLGHAGAVKSPTYTLVEPYELAQRTILHLDLYRLATTDDLEVLGLREQLDERSVALIEWPERGGRGLPPVDLELHLVHHPRGRALEAIAHSEEGRRLMVGILASS